MLSLDRCIAQRVSPPHEPCPYFPILYSRLEARHPDMALMLRDRNVRFVIPAKAEISDTELPARFSCVRFVNPAKAEISDTELFRRYSSARLVNPAIGERSDTELLLIQPVPSTYSAPRFNLVRLVANSSPVKLLILVLRA